jgi:hypothetical protein
MCMYTCVRTPAIYYFKNLAHVILKTGKFKIWELSQKLMLQFWEKFFLFWKALIFALMTFIWLNKNSSHIECNLFYLDTPFPAQCLAMVAYYNYVLKG